MHGPAQALKGAVEAGADSAAGWKALAELQYQNRSWAEAYETSVKGLEWSVRRRAAGCETLTQFALSLRLCYARCLRRRGRLDESEYAFKVLAGARACRRLCHVSRGSDQCLVRLDRKTSVVVVVVLMFCALC